MPSGYFSAPSGTLDPALFDGQHLKDAVRQGLLNTLSSGLEEALDVNYPGRWLRAWLAGSGVSYQWDANRGNSDLDVLFGADFPEFLRDNPHVPRLSMPEISAYVNDVLKQSLWPKTSHYKIGPREYEVTFYWNPSTGTSIDSIHPYAAYDLVNDEWTVRPPELPQDPRSLYPQQWHSVTEADYSNAWKIQDLYHGSGPSGKVQGENAARALWREIHEGRKEAFSDTGAGYSDFHNYRWQRAKETGAADILRGIVAEADASDELSAMPAPRDIITRAALRYAGPRYTP